MRNFYFTSRNVISFGCKLMVALLLLNQSPAWVQTSSPPKLSSNLPRSTTNPVVVGLNDQLLNKALGSEKYDDLFSANLQPDANTSEGPSDGSAKIIVAAKDCKVPLITAKQGPTRMEGRNGSAFSTMCWKGQNPIFTDSVGSVSRSLPGMLSITEGPDS